LADGTISRTLTDALVDGLLVALVEIWYVWLGLLILAIALQIVGSRRKRRAARIERR
jgi:hypothetical protein